jgi:hypothetical protein
MTNIGDAFDDLESNLESEAPTAKVRKAKTVKTSDTVRIVLEENDEIPPTGLFVGLNGRGYLIRPGEPVEVPVGVKEILDHAVMSSPQVDPGTKQVVGYRERMRYPYRLVNS